MLPRVMALAAADNVLFVETKKMLRRLIIFKGVFAASVLVSFVALFVYGCIQHAEQLQVNGSQVGGLIARELIGPYQWAIIGGSFAIAAWFAYGDLLQSGRAQKGLPTYSDEEFIARFGQGQK